MKKYLIALSSSLLMSCANVPKFSSIQDSNQTRGSNTQLLLGRDQVNSESPVGAGVDFNRDGIADGYLVDTDEDGLPDVVRPVDGSEDLPLVDTDGDEKVDGIDADNDGVPDSSIEFDNDGRTPRRIIPHGHDLTMCGENNDKVLVCHLPPGNPGNKHEICIGALAVKAHLTKGSNLGHCASQ